VFSIHVTFSIIWESHAVPMCGATTGPFQGHLGEKLLSKIKVRKENKIVLGSGQSIPSSLRSLHPSSTRPSASVFVSRLPPAATEEDLTEFVKSVFRVNASCIKLVTGRFHSSFKVTVTGVGVRRLYDSRKWPEMVLVRQFYDHGSENV